MSIFHYILEVGGPNDGEFEQVKALVDTGMTFTIIPSAILNRLSVEPSQHARFRLADGAVIQRAIDETQVRIKGQTFSRVIIYLITPTLDFLLAAILSLSLFSTPVRNLR